jgi:hypothetical protein
VTRKRCESTEQAKAAERVKVNCHFAIEPELFVRAAMCVVRDCTDLGLSSCWQCLYELGQEFVVRPISDPLNVVRRALPLYFTFPLFPDVASTSAKQCWSGEQEQSDREASHFGLPNYL